ncbi:hypothetical protein K1719_008305 [Acacia pycnantha]|nr:hypothetical protein K1719_008305 [Acacia pycnantha]
MADNGFKSGYANALQTMMEAKLPGCGIKATPHITSRLKTLKRLWQTTYDIIYGPSTSGFGWDPETKLITADDDIWDEYLKAHSKHKEFRTKPLPNFDSLCTDDHDHETGGDSSTEQEGHNEGDGENNDEADDDSKTEGGGEEEGDGGSDDEEEDHDEGEEDSSTPEEGEKEGDGVSDDELEDDRRVEEEGDQEGDSVNDSSMRVGMRACQKKRERRKGMVRMILSMRVGMTACQKMGERRKGMQARRWGEEEGDDEHEGGNDKQAEDGERRKGMMSMRVGITAAEMKNHRKEGMVMK